MVIGGFASITVLGIMALNNQHFTQQSINQPAIFQWNANISQGDPVFIYAVFSNDTNMTISRIIPIQVRAASLIIANSIMTNYTFQLATNSTCYSCPGDLIGRKDLNFTLLGTVT